MRIDVLSIFPDYLLPLRLSLVGKAISSGLVDLQVHDLRSWTHDRHRTVDDTPYGGGAGMVMRPEPWGEALDALVPGSRKSEPPPDTLQTENPPLESAGPEAVAERPTRLIVLTPSGRLFDQRLADELKSERHLVLACGRYEGIDARVVEHARSRMVVDEISIGDYVLNGGEAAALVLIEAVVRLIPGVIGNPESLTEESHSAGQDGLLEYPVYTKPPVWRGLEVPSILFSGHHAQIAGWRREQALALTAARRPELLPRVHPGSLDDVAISEATSSDAGELFTLQRAAFVGEARLNDSFALPPLTQTLEELQGSLGRGSILVARQAGRLIGSVRGEQSEPGLWYVGRLMVAPDLQGLGLGHRLMSEIEVRAPASCRAIRLVTGAGSRRNLTFYARRGYTEVAHTTDSEGINIVVLEKHLSDG